MQKGTTSRNPSVMTSAASPCLPQRTSNMPRYRQPSTTPAATLRIQPFLRGQNVCADSIGMVREVGASLPSANRAASEHVPGAGNNCARRTRNRNAPHLQPLCDLIGRTGCAEVVALRLVAGVFLQNRDLGFLLDAFSDNGQVEDLSQSNDGSRDRRIIAIGGKVTNEAPVDLDFVDVKLPKIAQAGVA